LPAKSGIFFWGRRRAADEHCGKVKVDVGRRGGRAIRSQELPAIPRPGSYLRWRLPDCIGSANPGA